MEKKEAITLSFEEFLALVDRAQSFNLSNEALDGIEYLMNIGEEKQERLHKRFCREYLANTHGLLPLRLKRHIEDCLIRFANTLHNEICQELEDE